MRLRQSILAPTTLVFLAAAGCSETLVPAGAVVDAAAPTDAALAGDTSAPRADGPAASADAVVVEGGASPEAGGGPDAGPETGPGSPDTDEGLPSAWVYVGNDGQLAYHTDGKGNRIPDFSYAGYGGGGVRLPVVDGPIVEVSPSGGDDCASIQAAIDEVAALPPDPTTGFRGVVRLRQGTYRVRGGLTGRRTPCDHPVIDASGIVLRGEGQGPNGTVIEATGTVATETDKPMVLEARGASGRSLGVRQPIVDAYVPVGARSFQVADAAGFSFGDHVLVGRTVTQAWVDRIGMDACDGLGGTSEDTADAPCGEEDIQTCSCLAGGEHWDWAGKDIEWERTVTAVAGNTVTIDAPIVQSLDATWGGGWLQTVTAHGRISRVGIEHLRGDSVFSGPTDENHAWHFIELNHVENAWVRDVTAVHLARSLVVVGKGRWVTIQDCTFAEPISQITGKRRYPFNIDEGQLTLVQRCRADHGRHSFAFSNMTSGPNVFLDGEATSSHTSSETHSHWSTGVLYDNVTDAGGITLMNEGSGGTGHGWSSAYGVLWNSRGAGGKGLIVSDPPTAKNWLIGGGGSPTQGDGVHEHVGSWANPTWVSPRSLYRRQLRDRLGPEAVANLQP